MQPLLLPLLLASIALFSTLPKVSAQEKPEETYSISLVQAAEAEKDVREVDGRKIRTEAYQVKAGDHLWRILRERGLTGKQTLKEVLELLKRLNSSLTNLDLLHPGETIIIPLVVSPAVDAHQTAPKAKEQPVVALENLKDVDLELYTIKPGDSLIRVVKDKYNIPDKDIHDEYLNLLRKMNPSIENLSRVRPGQKIRLPIYSPQVVRMPLPPPAVPEEPKPEIPREEASELMAKVGGVFKAMGFDWLDAGQHFIPLKSGGQVNLNADSFPILNLPSGRQIIVDFRDGLPGRMAKLITSSWDNYGIVRMKSGDGLREAVGKILSACGYPKVYRRSEPLEIPGRLSLQVKADWIIQTDEAPPQSRFVALTLLDPGSAPIPASLGKFLKDMGVRMVEYPKGKSSDPALPKTEPLKGGKTLREFVENILRLTGVNFSKDVEIPVYQSKGANFNLLVKADFLITGDQGERIVDLTGLGPDIVSLLREHQFPVLSLNERSDPASVVPGLLEFSGVPFDAAPHAFLAADREESRNVTITIPGVSFTTTGSQRALVPTCPLTETLAAFLSEKGYQVLEIDQP